MNLRLLGSLRLFFKQFKIISSVGLQQRPKLRTNWEDKKFKRCRLNYHLFRKKLLNLFLENVIVSHTGLENPKLTQRQDPLKQQKGTEENASCKPYTSRMEGPRKRLASVCADSSSKLNTQMKPSVPWGLSEATAETPGCLCGHGVPFMHSGTHPPFYIQCLVRFTHKLYHNI